MTTPPLQTLFIWHFHQPYYGLPDAEEFSLPWVRLHSVKAYYDMARLLETHPDVRATFNFSGSLLRQIIEYTEDDKRDRWWRLSKIAPAKLTLAQRRAMVRHFFSISEERGIRPLARYRQLHEHRHRDGISACARNFDDQQFLDLQVLFNLAWCGFSARKDYPIIEELRAKERDFTAQERDALLDVHAEILSRILPLYRKLADAHQIEISVTPMYHPIVPLVIDTDTMARCTPDRPRPPRYRAPEDARWHIDEALAIAEDVFGRRPEGMWPSEGSVSPEAVELFEDAGVCWIATDEDVLRHSRADQYRRDDDLWRPWRLTADGPRIFFRDHGLSDRLGFVYADNPADEAAEDLVSTLSDIHTGLDGEQGCVAIILDGENPWEHYTDDGRPFLSALYERLATNEAVKTTVPSEITVDAGHLDELHSGSWIMANYNIWIGHEETNCAWEWLKRADKHIKDRADQAHDTALERARHSLRIAQGSDWFWWYGDDFSSEQDDQFDALFRALVARVWTALDTSTPPQLYEPIHRTRPAGDAEHPHIQPPRQFISPTIDGTHRGFFDWTGAGHIAISGSHGSMYETFRPLKQILYGFSPHKFFLRLDPGVDFSSDAHLRIHLTTDDHSRTFSIPPAEPCESAELEVAFEDVAEFCVDLDVLELSPGDEFQLAIAVHKGDLQIQRFPLHGAFHLRIPSVDPGREYWIV